jgi:hypothetical protein
VSERRVSGQLPSHAPRGEQKKAARATPHDPSAVSRQGLAPDFTSRLMHDLSHAYTAVIVVAIILVAPMFVPGAFLPRKPVFTVAAQTPLPAPSP